MPIQINHTQMLISYGSFFNFSFAKYTRMATATLYQICVSNILLLAMFDAMHYTRIVRIRFILQMKHEMYDLSRMITITLRIAIRVEIESQCTQLTSEIEMFKLEMCKLRNAVIVST